MNSTKFILSLTKVCKTLEREFPKKKQNINSMRTFLYEIIENLLPVNYDYNGKRIKLKSHKNKDEGMTILESLNNANKSIRRNDYDTLMDHLINMEVNAMDIALAVKKIRKNIKIIVKEVDKVHFPNKQIKN